MYILWRTVSASVIHNALIKQFLDDIYKTHHSFEDGLCGGSSKGVHHTWAVHQVNPPHQGHILPHL